MQTTETMEQTNTRITGLRRQVSVLPPLSMLEAAQGEPLPEDYHIEPYSGKRYAPVDENNEVTEEDDMISIPSRRYMGIGPVLKDPVQDQDEDQGHVQDPAQTHDQNQDPVQDPAQNHDQDQDQDPAEDHDQASTSPQQNSIQPGPRALTLTLTVNVSLDRPTFVALVAMFAWLSTSCFR